MEYFFLSLVVRPIIVFVVLVLICLPARLAVHRWVPDGKVKQWLLRPVRNRNNR